MVIKQGEHGAFLFTSDRIFFAPAFPLETVFDPTGAGDAFAGGFMGYLARTGDCAEDEYPPRDGVRGGDGLVRRREVLDPRLIEITLADVDARVARLPAVSSQLRAGRCA